MSVGAIEPQFYSELMCVAPRAPVISSLMPIHRRLLAPYFPTDRPSPSAKAQHDASTWPDLRRILTDTFATRTRDEWTATFLSTDACAVPVLTTDEVSTTPTPAPQLARTPARAPPEGENEMLEPGRDTEAILLEAGLTKSEILALARDRIVLLGGPRARL
jgi:alpha-methylacyl-CoA racemase